MKIFQQYSIITIIQVIVLSALSIKGLISFIEWVFPRIKNVIKRIDQPTQNYNNLKQQMKEIDTIKKSIDKLTDMMSTLIQSDKEAIKAYITKDHHYFVYQKGWIDDYSLDCIQRRYNHYVEEGGNSFIKGLMEELRKLPKKQRQNQI